MTEDRRPMKTTAPASLRRARVSDFPYRAEVEAFEQRLSDGLPFDDLEGPDDIRARLAALDDA